MQVGKYKGQSYQTIIDTDRQYCAWVLREQNLPKSLTKFARYLRMVHGGILPCGKYKGQFFDEVEQNDSGYCDWVSSLKEPDVFKSFVDYLKGNDEPPNKKQKTDQ